MPRAEEPRALRFTRERVWTDDANIADMPIHLLRSTDVTPRGKVIYMALRYNATEYEGILMTSGDQRHFAADAGLTLKTFANGLPELEQRHWVVVLRPSEEEKIVTINGADVRFRIKRNPGGVNPLEPKPHHTVWGNVYFLPENLIWKGELGTQYE